MKHLLIITLLLTLTTGCANRHKKRLAEIESAFKAGELSRGEYLQLKHQEERAQAQRAYQIGRDTGNSFNNTYYKTRQFLHQNRYQP